MGLVLSCLFLEIAVLILSYIVIGGGGICEDLKLFNFGRIE